jgi:hypothetical protein
MSDHATGLAHLLFLILGVIFFCIAIVAARRSIAHRRSSSAALDRQTVQPAQESSFPWVSIQNISAILGIASFIIQILQWMQGR